MRQEEGCAIVSIVPAAREIQRQDGDGRDSGW